MQLQQPMVPQGYAPGYAPGYVYMPMPPRAMQYQSYDGGPVPAGMHVEERPRRGLTITGGVLFGVSYGLSATVGILGLSDRSSDGLGWFLVPALGPVIWALTSNRDGDGLGVAYATLDTIVQCGALAMWIYGALNPSRVLVPNGYADARPRWLVTPGAAGAGRGVTFSATF